LHIACVLECSLMVEQNNFDWGGVRM